MHSAENGKTADAGQRLVGNRYLVHEAIGRGGYGVVRRGHDTLLGREVALKEIRFLAALSSTRAGKARSRMLQEARASAVVTNAHAITVYDIIQEEDDGDLHIVMELLDGRTLTQLVEDEGSLSPQRAATIGLQVLDALEAAHGKGVVHRDVKPGNVMVMAGDHAKLGDFGLASLAGDSDLTMTGEVVGTPAYMAPEQASGEDAGPPADLWGLGATLYFAVEGIAPFGGGSSMSTMLAVVNAPPRPAARAGALGAVLDGLLAKYPEERPGPDELRELLAEVAAGDGAEEPARGGGGGGP
ncbi:MAG: serine/threonine protein kinase, partial [Pseudonocardia sp.]|nr:serine/threonine protein kinase [Pseudonocardia sp.]